MSSSVETPAPAAVETMYAARPRGRLRRRRLTIGASLFVIGLGLAAGAYWLGLPAATFGRGVEDDSCYRVEPVTLNITLKEDGELKPVNSHQIKCEVEGGQLTIEWVIDESTRVSKGDLLLRLSSADLKERVELDQIDVEQLETSVEEAKQSLTITRSENDSRISKAEVDLNVAELELQRYVKGDFEKERKRIDIDIEKTLMNLDQKKDEFDKSVPLHERGFITKSKIDELESTIKQLEMTLERHRLEMAALLDYDYPKNLLQKQSAVDQAREELEREKQRAASRERQAVEKLSSLEKTLAIRRERFERLKEQYAKCEIRAPIDGVVQYGESGGRRWWNNNRIAPGEHVYAGQTLLTIPDTSQMMVSTRIHEADRHMISEDLPCLVRVPAVPGATFRGRLSKIAKFADSENSWWNPELKEHAAEILLEDTQAEISPGDTAQVEIMIEEVQDVLAVPVQCVFSRGPKRFVFVGRTSSAEPAEVKLGRSSTTMIEVVDGLEAGDRVLMHVEDRLLAKLPAPSTMRPEMPEPEGGTPQRGAESEPKVSAAPATDEQAKTDGKRPAEAEG